MMIDDHGKIVGTLRELGAKEGVPLQTKVLFDPELEALRGKEGHAFDVAYIALAGPAAHERAIRLYEAEARTGRDGLLRAFAAQTLPSLKAHLAAARKLSATIAAPR
jgi:putative membrane protein